MGTDRTWLIRKTTGTDRPFDSKLASIVGPPTEPVSVVEESRLREAEADARDWKERCILDGAEALGRVERLEAELREAREALADLGHREHGCGVKLSRVAAV